MANFYIGTKIPANIYLGEALVQEVWVGKTLVWSNLKEYELFNASNGGAQNGFSWFAGHNSNSESGPRFAPSQPTYGFRSQTDFSISTPETTKLKNTLFISSGSSGASWSMSGLFNSSYVNLDNLGFTPKYLHVDYSNLANTEDGNTTCKTSFSFGLATGGKSLNFTTPADADATASRATWEQTAVNYQCSDAITSNTSTIQTATLVLDLTKIESGKSSVVINAGLNTQEYRTLAIYRVWFSNK